MSETNIIDNFLEDLVKILNTCEKENIIFKKCIFPNGISKDDLRTLPSVFKNGGIYPVNDCGYITDESGLNYVSILSKNTEQFFINATEEEFINSIKPILITEDGFKIMKNDPVWWVNIDNDSKYEQYLSYGKANKMSCPSDSYKYFYCLEKLQNFILKTLFVKND